MQLTSADFKDRQDIPREFTCQGKDISPALSWTNPPQGTKGFAFSVRDPDAPNKDWVHWLIHGIPATATGFPKNSNQGVQVMNDFGKADYGGPCPPSGKHRYVFTLFALDVANLGDVKNKNDFDAKVKSHAIGQATLIGMYQKS